MKKYYYLTAGRRVWVDLAILLAEKDLARPILHFGDPRNENELKRLFPDSVYGSAKDLTYGTFHINININNEWKKLFTSKEYEEIKANSLKLMNRLDFDGTFRLIDREVLFNKICLWVIDKLQKEKPDYLIAAESPHDHTAYIIYALCNFIGIKSLIFGSWTHIPALYLTYGLNGNRVNVESRQKNTNIDKLIIDNLSLYIESDKFKNGAIPAPKYMELQLKREESGITFLGLVSHFKIWILVLLRKKNIISYSKKHIWFIDLLIAKNNFEILNILPFKNYITPYFFLKNKIINLRKKILHESYKKNSEIKDLNSLFVYFPLHFEPERTTIPDGGIYHDQFRVIALIRSLLPNNISLIIKEHKSQFYSEFDGYRSRSPFFYDLLKSINNIQIAPLDTDSSTLIRCSQFVVTISGTSAIEAALLGKKALIFGDSWFRDCPNIISYDERFNMEDFLKCKLIDTEYVKNWIKENYIKEGIPGFQNPSGEARYSSYDLNNEYREIELEAIFDAINTAISIPIESTQL